MQNNAEIVVSSRVIMKIIFKEGLCTEERKIKLPFHDVQTIKNFLHIDIFIDFMKHG